jgi:uncharacterized protein
MAELLRPEDRRRVLTESRVVAVVGAHHEAHRPAFYVPDYLHRAGYRVRAVNPSLVGRTLWGSPVVARLAEIAESIDLVDVFRRGDALPEHLDELLALRPPPRAVWFQLGVRNPSVVAALVAAGLDVVQDHCTMADHRRLVVADRR